jgi:8-oxo-dGTP diphosphatase
MNLRVLSGALIIEGNDYLLMKRSETKKIAPGMWGGVGGHAEPSELNSPKATCLREVYEETGIKEKDLENLDLRHIIMSRNNIEITLIYFFIAFSKTRNYEDKTQEGKLYWINENELLRRPMSFEVRNMVEHYIKEGYKSNGVNVGSVSITENNPTMNWNALNSLEEIMGV